MSDDWIREPEAAARLPVVVSIPHFGTTALPGITADDYVDPDKVTYAYGFADAFAADLYGGLNATGATLLAFPYSRLFVDVNRRRDDYEVRDGEVYSLRGVVRTHTIAEAPVFARALTAGQAQARLDTYYEPYHQVLGQLVERMRIHYGGGLLLDAHTGSERGMGEHEVVLGTRRGATCAPELRDIASAIVREHGFAVHHDVPGYSGGYTVRCYGEPRERGVHALQFEVNSSLLMAGTRQEFMASVRGGDAPRKDEQVLSRMRACVGDVVVRLGKHLAATSTSAVTHGIAGGSESSASPR